MLQLVVELVDRDPGTQQVQDRARVDRAGARRHRHALERREAHARVDGTSVPHGGHRRARRRGGRRPGARLGQRARPRTAPPARGSRSAARRAPRAAAAAGRRWPPRLASRRGRPCRTPRRAAGPGAPPAPAGSRRAPRRCAAAPARPAAAMRRSLAASSRTGSRKTAPPWTTRWPTAPTSSGACSSAASGSTSLVRADQRQLQAGRAGVDHEHAAHCGHDQPLTSGGSSPCSRV